ncbi:hypothetical protein [Arthrobacter cavernae]|uniref:Uncharacterized protein n=1 Tax=Arthrobacter cavernae TaxID=2817681 RepID=A0A939KP64_9MICC|nr:hypothetical protein [Arthrobacter cavernae]MBO1268335.1 hypothetical protein [Arthrobacter cavernae]
MCYPYSKDYRWDTKKDASREPEERPEPRVDAKDFSFWVFPRRHREFRNDPEPVIDRSRERVFRA